MEYHAEICYTREDLEQFQRFHRRYRKRGRYLLSCFCMALVVVFCVAEIGYLLIHDYGFYYQYLFWLMLAFVVIRSVVFSLRIRKAIDEGCKRLKSTSIVFREDGYEGRSENAEGRSDYSMFQTVYHWRGYYYFYRDKTNAMIVPEHSLTEGHPEAFSAFLSGRCGLKVVEIK